MALNMVNEKVLDFEGIFKEPELGLKLWPRRNAVSLKWTLRSIDFFLAFISLVLSASIFGYLSTNYLSLKEWISFLLFALLIIIFFPQLKLYSRHLIFSKNKHIAHLLKAFGLCSIIFALIVSVYNFSVTSYQYCHFLFVIAFFLVIGILSFFRSENTIVFHLFKVFGISMLTMGILIMMYEERIPDFLRRPEMMICGICLAMVSIFVGRLAIVHVFFGTSLKRYFRRQIAMIGNDEQGRKVVSYIIDRDAPFWVAGTIGEKFHLNTQVRKNWLGSVEELPEIITAYKIDDLLIADKNFDKKTLICILDYCLKKGVDVWFPPSFLEIIDRKLYIDNFCGLPMIKLCSTKCLWMVNKIKHSLDAIIGLPLFLLLLPLFGVIAAAIKITSPGPVFYRAKAIGKMGREFTMYKFRSMRVNNDAQIHKAFVTKLIKGEIGTENDQGQPLKITNDPRITFVGSLLRKLSLDELPQLINVIKGDMSLIGPRPCLPYEFEVYKDWYKKRASIRPGISGLWQVTGRSEVSFEDMILLDLYYVYNRSIWIDLDILMATVFVVLKKKGAY